MDNFILLALCMGLGMCVVRIPSFPKNATTGLNAFIIYFALPALTLYYIPKLSLAWEMLYPAGMAWLVFGLAFLIFNGLGRLWGWSNAVIGCLILTCGLCNTSFVGLPLLDVYFGTEGVKYGILADQGGSFFVLCLLGLPAAAYYSVGKGVPLPQLLRRMLHFPPFLAFLVALSLRWIEVPPVLDDVFYKLGQTLSPLALASVGMQVQFRKVPFPKTALYSGLLYSLFLAPLFILLLYRGAFQAEGLPVDVAIFEAATPPMVTGGIVASEHGLAPALASLLIGVGIVLSFLTTYLWVQFL